MGMGGHEACRQVMSALFELYDGFEMTVPTVHTAAAGDNGEGDSDSDASSSSGKEDRDVWVRVQASNLTAIQDQLDSNLEAASFCLVEPVYLGLFPFQTEASPEKNNTVDATVGSTVEEANDTALTGDILRSRHEDNVHEVPVGVEQQGMQRRPADVTTDTNNGASEERTMRRTSSSTSSEERGDEEEDSCEENNEVVRPESSVSG